MKNVYDSLTFKDISNLLDNVIQIIFKDKNMNTLSDYEKRKYIYDYMVENKQYDDEYFKNILNNYDIQKNNVQRDKKIFSRNLNNEFIEPLVSDKGICNGFSQIYKLLLEKVGVFSYCINCMVRDDNRFVGHQLNLVCDNDNKSFSLDDVTFGIIKKTKNEYFDYTCEEALFKDEMEGYFPIMKNIKWAILDEDIINYYAKREHGDLIQPIDSKIIQNMKIEDINDFNKYGIYIKSQKDNIKECPTLN